jgi:DNA invertase Pin-like site-specific DNA recombinase
LYPSIVFNRHIQNDLLLYFRWFKTHTENGGEMLVGYARTSTLEQVAGFEAQKRELQQLGCTKIFSEQVSSVAERAELDRAIDFIREGDTFVVTKIDRLARSMADLMTIIARIKAKGAALRIVELSLDTGTATGELILNILGSVAQFERKMMLERQKEGIAKAKKEGLYKGRQATAQALAGEVLALSAEGLGVSQIMERINTTKSKSGKQRIGVTSVYNIIAAHRRDQELATA